MSADDKLVGTAFEHVAKSASEANLDQYDKWFAERGIETERAHWKGRAEASEAKIAALTAELENAEQVATEVHETIELTLRKAGWWLSKNRPQCFCRLEAAFRVTHAALRQEGKP